MRFLISGLKHVFPAILAANKKLSAAIFNNKIYILAANKFIKNMIISSLCNLYKRI
jgi:hypothetical protein